MKYTRFIYIILIAVSFTSCKKQELKPYDSGQYIQFTSSGIDTALFSFLNYPGATNVELTLPVMMTGFKTTEDLNYKVVVDPKGTNAPAKNFSLPSNFVFRAGRQVDSVRIILKNSAELQSNQYTLLVRLESTPEIGIGQTTFTYKYIKFTDQVVKPVWWNDIMDRFGLGLYTIKKYRLFIEVTGVGDLSRFSDARQLELMRIFKAYLGAEKDKGTPVLEADGTDMLLTVPLK